MTNTALNILPVKSGIRIVMRPSLFKPGVKEFAFPYEADKEVGYYLDDAGFTVPPGMTGFVAVGNKRCVKHLEPEDWDVTVPAPGDLITVAAVPGNMGGGGGKKSILSTILTIASFALAFVPGGQLGFLGATAFGGVTWGRVIGFGLTIIGGLISQPPKQKASVLARPAGMAPSSPTYRLEESTNQVNPHGKVPRVVGTVRWRPPLAAKPYQEVVGKELFYRVLLACGYGRVKNEDIRFGETAATEFEGVKIVIREGRDSDGPLTLYSQDIDEEKFDVLMKQSESWATRTSLIDVDEISLDFVFPRLTKVTGGSSRVAVTVVIEVEYAPVGTEDWLDAVWEDAETGFEVDGEITVTANETSEVWVGGRFMVTGGQYKVRVRRVTNDATDTQVIDEVHWAVLRSIRHTSPINVPGMSTIEMRIKSTNELQGRLPPISVQTTSYLDVWDSGTQTWSNVLSQNPAWACIDQLMGPSCPRPRVDSQMDLDAFADFADHCDAYGLKVNGVIDYSETVLDVFNDIAEAGWGRYTLNGTLHSVMWDRVIAAPTQHFTPHNTIKFKREKLFPKRPHALLCHFRNEERNYQSDLRTVYAPGYDEGSATEFEDREYHLFTDPAQIWKHATREIAVSIYRDINAELQAEADYLVARPGQTVSVTRPETGWGLGSGRVKTATVSQVILTDAVPMEAAKTYSIGFRYGDSETKPRKIFDLQSPVSDGEFTTVDFAADIAVGDVPVEGDLFQFGETDFVARDFIVINIDARNGSQGTLFLSPYGTEVLDTIAGTPPAYVSPMSDQPSIDRRPAKPVVENVSSDEDVMIALPGGGWQPRIVISLQPRTGDDYELEIMTCRYRRSDGGIWKIIPYPPATREITLTEVEEGVDYDIWLRVVTRYGLPSEFAQINGHTVIGRTTPPPDVPAVYLHGNDIEWPYLSPPRDFSGFRIKSRAGTVENWDDATQAHQEDVWPNSSFDISGLPSGVRTIMVKAVDDSGNESAASAVLIKDLGDALVDNVIVTRDYAAENFPGTITNGQVAGGVIDADDNGSLYLPDNNAPYLSDSTELYLPLTFKEMTYDQEFVPPADAIPAQLTLSTTIVGENWDIEYRIAGDGPYLPNGDELYLPDGAALYLGGPGDYRPWPGAIDDVTRQKYTFKSNTAGGNVQGIISEFKVNLDVPDIEESFEDLVIAAGGTRLPITRSYRKIVVVGGIALQADGGDAVRLDVIDKDADLGPLLECFDAANATTTGTVDITKMQGY